MRHSRPPHLEDLKFHPKTKPASVANHISKRMSGAPKQRRKKREARGEWGGGRISTSRKRRARNKRETTAGHLWLNSLYTSRRECVTEAASTSIAFFGFAPPASVAELSL